jgi:hypothetical protein
VFEQNKSGDADNSVIWFWTESGAIYRIDRAQKTWQRMSDHYALRTADGAYDRISDITIGKPVVLRCPPIVEGSAVRIIRSTPVVRWRIGEHC